MKITFFVRYVYGKPTMYLQQGDIANAIHTLTRRQTVDMADLDALSKLGHEVVQVLDPSTCAYEDGQCQHEMCRLSATHTVVLNGQAARLCAEHGRIADMGNWQHIRLAEFKK